MGPSVNRRNFLRMLGTTAVTTAAGSSLWAPKGRRLYFSSQRAPHDGPGITYEVEGPFRHTA